MGNWLDRTAITVGLAFIAGIAAAVIVFVIVLKVTGGDDNNNNAPKPTATSSASTPATATPAETAGATTTTTPSPAAPTATPGTYTNPDDALAGFVQGDLNTTYLGACTQSPAQGICSTDLLRTDELVTVFLGPPLSEGLGEAIVTKGAGGNWTVEFLLAPQGGGQLSAGIQAVVYGAGSCLNFHEEARIAGKTLSCQPDGAKARVVSGPVQADDITWWQLDGLGWGSAEFLVPAAQ